MSTVSTVSTEATQGEGLHDLSRLRPLRRLPPGAACLRAVDGCFWKPDYVRCRGRCRDAKKESEGGEEVSPRCPVCIHPNSNLVGRLLLQGFSPLSVSRRMEMEGLDRLSLAPHKECLLELALREHGEGDANG